MVTDLLVLLSLILLKTLSLLNRAVESGSGIGRQVSTILNIVAFSYAVVINSFISLKTLTLTFCLIGENLLEERI